MLEERIPGNVPVFLRVDRPTVFSQTDAGQRLPLLGPVPGAAAQPFVIESAPRPLVSSAGLAVAAAGVQLRSRIPTLAVLPGNPGKFTEVAVVPAWAAIGSLTPAPPAAGLVPKGRYGGFIPEFPWDPNGSVPNSGHRPAGHLLRLRWTGTPEAAQTVDAGGNSGFSFQLLDIGLGVDAKSIAPGSVVITATIGGNAFTIRDDGAGRLYGQDAVSNEYVTGSIDYLAGTITLTFSAATDAVAVTADYEHTCLYLPLDLSLDWDAEMAQG